MITLSNDQMALFTQVAEEGFVERLCAALREQFPQELAAYAASALRRQVGETLQRARGYGLESEADCSRYLNLAVTCGWAFDEQPDNAWMRNYLTDPDITLPGKRLHRLVDRCLHLERVEQQNAALRQQLSAGSDNALDGAVVAVKE